MKLGLPTHGCLSLCNGESWGERLGIAAARLGLMDKVLYVSEVQRESLEAGGVSRVSAKAPEAPRRLRICDCAPGSAR